MAHAAPPTDVELAIRIEKLADYVARNGAKFEQITRQNQQGNPEFQFLEEGNINNKYYRHVLNCLLNGGWTLDQIIQVRNSQPLLQTNTNALTPEEDMKIRQILGDLNESKEAINNGREWIVQHSNKLSFIMSLIEKRAKQLYDQGLQTGGGVSYHIHIRYLVYLLNDIFLRSNQEIRNQCSEQLPSIMFYAMKSSNLQSEKEIINKVANMWKSKNIFSMDVSDRIMSAMGSMSPPIPNQQVQPHMPSQQQHFPPQPHQQQQQFPPQPHQQQQQQFPPQPHQQPPFHQLPPNMMGGPPQSFMGVHAMGGPPHPPLPNQANFNPQVPPPNFGQRPPFPPPGPNNTLPPPPGVMPPSSALPPPLPSSSINSQVAAALSVNQNPPPPSTDVGSSTSLSSQIRMQMSQINNQPGSAALSALTSSTPRPTNTQIQPPPPPKKTLINLEEIPVGAMAGIIKVALGSGHKKYAPFDMNKVLSYVPPPVEPGRLEARVNEYYRKMESDKTSSSSSTSSSTVSKSSKSDNRREGYREESKDDDSESSSSSRSHRSDRRRSRSRSSERWNERRERRNSFDYDNRSDNRSSTVVTGGASKTRSLQEDNVGYGMLKGMGWQEGKGLGVVGKEGIQQPINDGGQLDKVGVGVRTGQGEGDFFEAYRSERSGTYHRRIEDRSSDRR